MKVNRKRALNVVDIDSNNQNSVLIYKIRPGIRIIVKTVQENMKDTGIDLHFSGFGTYSLTRNEKDITTH